MSFTDDGYKTDAPRIQNKIKTTEAQFTKFYR